MSHIRILFVVVGIFLTVTNAAAAPRSARSKGVATRTAVVVDSLALLESEVAKDSTRFDNLFRLGVMYLEQEKNESAFRVLFKANRVRPRSVKVLVNLGLALGNLGRLDASEAYYREALEVAPQDPIAECHLARAFYAQGKYGQAVDELRELLARQPDSSCGYFSLGEAFADVGLYREAMRMWRKVIEFAPNSPEAISARESIEVLERVMGAR